MATLSVKRFASETGETMPCSCCGRDCKRGYIISGRYFGDKCGANLLGISLKKLNQASDKGVIEGQIMTEQDVLALIKNDTRQKFSGFSFAEDLKIAHKQIKPLVDKGLVVKENHSFYGTIYKVVGA